MPLLCCRRRLQVEGLHQIESGGAHVQAIQSGPQVDHVSLFLTSRFEAMEDVLCQVDAEGAASAIGAVDRTGAAFLGAGAAQLRRKAEMFEDTLEGTLFLQVDKIDGDFCRHGYVGW